MKQTRLLRLLKLLTLIQGGSRWTPTKLAEACGVKERTIFRDLSDLRATGIPIRFDNASKEYRVDPDFFLPPVQLSRDEALALSVLCEHVAGSEQIAFTGPAWRAMQKVRAAMPPDVREEVEKLDGSLSVRTGASSPSDGYADVFERLQEALGARKALVCRYESLSGSGEGEAFDFEPYALFFSVRAWYAVGFHAGRGGVRTLKLSRFTQAKPTERLYEIPKDFSLDTHIGNAWRMIPGEPEHEVEIVFDASFAETVADTLWHKTQTVEEHDDGRVTFRCTVAGLDEIVWWVLSMGPHCRVVKPEALASRVRDLSEQTAARYRPSGSRAGL